MIRSQRAKRLLTILCDPVTSALVRLELTRNPLETWHGSKAISIFSNLVRR
jgi:hypothetical protein